MSGLIVNGRFLSQGLTGVQRFATEVTSALAALTPLRVVVPPGVVVAPFATEVVGTLTGNAWEQFDLPRHVRGQVLLNLGNAAPLLVGRRQAVVIHDAGVFDTPDSYSLAFRAWYRLMHAGLARRGARLVTVSQFSRGRIATRLNIDPARIAVMPEGGEHILRMRPDQGVLERHGLQRGRYALAVGTRAAHKNLAALSGAAEMLATRGMSLAAAGAADPSVFRPATGGPGAVALGRVTDAELRALYENALCLVFPSRYEGFGLPPLEAMVCGCPVVASRAGAVPEVCGDAALWFDPAEPESLPQALARLIDEEGLAEACVARGHAIVPRFTWARAANCLLRLIEDVPA
ncbi:glycosyl transferase family 1 [Humitalea rosea]|uniref:Glycosyl transferase family 1 n=1 Tax=Humitalea rosea TaxID=990373 RepID=A0A2W7IN10_9PROT|nr:glycosyltransferase family 1 protein [Humitalea rosea]PZW48343.1 glycosyl transferase family 1 [Humitalea rosea]